MINNIIIMYNKNNNLLITILFIITGGVFQVQKTNSEDLHFKYKEEQKQNSKRIRNCISKYSQAQYAVEDSWNVFYVDNDNKIWGPIYLINGKINSCYGSEKNIGYLDIISKSNCRAEQRFGSPIKPYESVTKKEGYYLIQYN